MIKETFCIMAIPARWQFKNFKCPLCNNYLTVGFPFICEDCYRNLNFLGFIIKDEYYRINCESNVIELFNDFIFENYDVKLKTLINKMKTEKNFLNPKNLIITSIKEKLAGENVERIILVLSFIDEDRYSISIKPLDSEKPLLFDVKPKDVSLIKKIFVNKIYRTIKEKDKYKAVILEIDLLNESLELFLQDNKNDVIKYDYKYFNS